MKTFAEHLMELKIRLIICVIALTIGSGIGFIVHKPIEVILQKPLGQTLYYTNPAGGLSLVMQIALGVGVLMALPVLLFQITQFVRPAVKPIKNRHIILLLLSSMILTASAIIYAYVVSLPTALHFLTTFNSPGVKALISVNDYLKFLFSYLMGTVLAFQLPLILFFTNKIRRFPPGSLLKLQRPAIVGSIVFAGVITPTVDPMNQVLVAMPIIALFEIGAIAVLISNKANKPARQKPILFEIKRPATLTPFFEHDVSPKVPQPVLAITNTKPALQSQSTFRDVEHKPRQTRGTIIMDILSPNISRPVHG